MKNRVLLSLFAVALGVLLSASAEAVTMRFDVGRDDSVANVNAITWLAQDVANAIDSTGAATGVSLTVDLVNSTGWNEIGPNDSGENPAAAPASGFFPEGDITKDALFGHTSNFNAGAPRDSVIYDIAGLASNTDYDFTFYASRGTVSDIRDTSYDVDGNIAVLDAGNNVGGIAQLLGVTSNGSGELTLTIGKGPNNSNGSEFFYLGAMQINTSIPEPTSLCLFGFGVMGLMGVARRRS